MAIDYIELAVKLGQHIGRINSYAPIPTTLAEDVQKIAEAYGTDATEFGESGKPIEGISAAYVGFQNNITSWRTGLLPFAQSTLTDQDTIVSQLVGLSATDVTSVLKAIVKDMNDNSETIDASVVTIGSVTAGAGNIGNGTVLVDKTLDGFTVPVTGGFASKYYDGLASQLAVNESMTFVCTADSFSGGGQEGSEQWSWVGGQKFPSFDFHAEGSGNGPSLTTANGATTLVRNLGFTAFSVANTPDSWTIAAGGAGSSIFKETTAAKIYRGLAALRFTGTGSVMPAITQAITAGLKARKRYLFTIRIFTDGAAATGGEQISLKFTGTGYTASSTEKIEQTVVSLTGAYVLKSFYINLPATIPSDFKLSISIITANLTSGTHVYFSSGSFTEVVYFGGVNAQVVAGSTPWTLGDRLTVPITNDKAGLFQEFFRRAFSTQLPSETDGSETISDDYALFSAPTVTMTTSASDPTTATLVPVTVAFSASVSGFIAGDVTVTNSTLSNFAGSSASYSFDLAPTASNAYVTANIPAGVASDLAGNENAAAPQFKFYKLP